MKYTILNFQPKHLLMNVHNHVHLTTQFSKNSHDCVNSTYAFFFFKNLHNSIHSMHTFFKECTKLCILNIFNFSKNIQNSIHSTQFLNNIHNSVYSTIQNYVNSTYIFKRMYIFLYI